MSLSEIERRVLRNIEQNTILAAAATEGDVVDPSTGKAAVPAPMLHTLLEGGYVAWKHDEEHGEEKLVLTARGQAALEGS